MKIPFWLWLAVGLFITLASSALKMKLFIWVGLLFLAIGIGKMVFEFIFKERKPKEKIIHQQAQQRYYYCPRCKIRVHVAEKFCRMCGQRLR